MFTVNNDIFRGPKIYSGSRDVATPFQGQFVIRRMGLAMINPRTKFEVSMFTN